MPIPKVSLIERVGCKLRALPAEAFGHVQSSTVICGFNVKKIESVMWSQNLMSLKEILFFMLHTSASLQTLTP